MNWTYAFAVFMEEAKTSLHQILKTKIENGKLKPVKSSMTFILIIC